MPLIDLTNKIFGNWVVLNRVPKLSNKDRTVDRNVKWLCLCNICDRKFEVNGKTLRKGISTQCFECNFKNLHPKDKIYFNIGQKFGLWTIIDTGGISKYGDIEWQVQCICGKTRWIRGTLLNKKRSTGCKICKNKAAHPLQCFFIRLSHGAKRRNLEVNITKEYLLDLLEKQDYKCALTGQKLILAKTSTKKNSETASVDRIDSSQGYIIGNVQWVHKYINIMKSDHNEIDFINFCLQVADFHRNKNNEKNNYTNH